jgi:hypothetical protein
MGWPGMAGALDAAATVAALAEGAAVAIAVPATAAVRHETEIAMAAECLTAARTIRIALGKDDIPALLRK